MRLSSVRTNRLCIRTWRDEDLAPFAAMNADPEVMEFFPSVLTRDESDALAANIRGKIEKHGFGFWVVETLPSGDTPAQFCGFTGVSIPSFEPPFETLSSPCVEVGWRFARAFWGNGYATEAAAAAVAYGMTVLRAPELVSFTVPENVRSRRVMERLDMVHDPESDFDHPNVPEGHRLRRHVLYRIENDQ